MFKLQQSESFADLFSTWNTLRRAHSLNELLTSSARLTRLRVSAQSSSIFLFSKLGILERNVIDALDRSRNPVPGEWYREEHYHFGEGFTGRVVVPAEDSSFGKLQILNDLNGEFFGPESGPRYEEILGTLRSAAAAPLNGSNHTYGVLQVLNKVDSQTGDPVDGTFSDQDLDWLSVIAIATAAAITILRNSDRLSLLAKVSQMGARPLLENEDPQSAYESIARELTGPLAPYRACVIRVGTTPENLEVTARAGDGVNWEKRDDTKVATQSIYTNVFNSGEPELIEDILPRIREFAHQEWVIDNAFKSLACFPLVAKQRSLGTLSLYTSYRHIFDAPEIDFIRNISFLLASLSEAFHRVGALQLDDRMISDEQARNLSGSRIVGHDQIVTELRHSYKGFLVKLKTSLEEIDAGGRSGRKIEELIKEISRKVSGVLDEFDSVAHSKVNINHIVQAVAKSYARDLKAKSIKIELSLSSDVPDIEASDVEVRDVVVNLMTNSIRAIEESRQRHGLIAIRTDITKQNRIEMLELVVEDNGIGIRNEDKENIFKYRFTRYPNGSGVGLYVVQSIVRNYDGVIDLDSAVGKGTTFKIRLPLARLRMEKD